MNDFTFHIPTKIYFGKDCLNHIAAEMGQSGTKVLIAYGGGSVVKSGLLDRIKSLLGGDFELYECEGIEPNPKMESIRRGVSICKEKGIEMILALGGGSVIDASKAIAAGACADFDAWDFFGAPRKAVERALPIYTVVTMASTGSEMTCGAVISNEETLEKTGRAGFPLFPKASFLDPELTYTVPAYQTACGSADIFSHVFESYFNRDNGFDLLDGMMEAVMRSVVKNSKIALYNPYDYGARSNLLWAASWAMNGFFGGGSRQMWSCHPIEHELSARYDITHGLGLAIIMPRWLRYCLSFDLQTKEKITTFGEKVFGTTTAEGAIKALENFLYEDLKLDRSLAEIGLGDADSEDMARSVCKNGPVKGYCNLDEKGVKEILEDCKL